MKRSILIICIFFLGISCYTQKIYKLPGDTIMIQGPKLQDDLKEILLKINYRKLAKIEITEDSVRYNFTILGVEKITDMKLKIRVLHTPLLEKDKYYLQFYDALMAYYQVRLEKRMGKLKLKDVKYLMGEL